MPTVLYVVARTCISAKSGTNSWTGELSKDVAGWSITYMQRLELKSPDHECDYWLPKIVFENQ